jgi:hypothetical protein
MVKLNLLSSAPMRRVAVRDLARDESGASAIVVGLSMTAMLGFAGLAVDTGVWYADRRTEQDVADSAAFSAAKDLYAGDSVHGAKSAAQAVAAQSGFTSGSNGVTVTVNSPPASGPNSANANAVEVIVSKSENLFFTTFFRNSTTVSARAVASAGTAGNGSCMEATGTGASTSISTADVGVSGNINIDLSHCGISANSTGSDSLDLTGNATVTAATLTLVGNYSVNNNASLTVTGAKTTGAPATPDPYANVSAPSPGSCASTNSWNGTATISPGTYCGGFTLTAGAAVTMQPGTYIIDGGSFSVAGHASLSGTGVTIVLTGTSGNYATATINGNSTVNLSAPTSGDMSGLVFLQDRNDTSGATSKLVGGTSMSLTGAAYFPTQTLQFAGGSSNASQCTEVVAQQISFAGSSYLNDNCAGDGVTPIGQSVTKLVE